MSVCVCTYKRPVLLAKLLDSLASQAIEDNFTYEVVVVDNDKTGAARVVVEAAQKDIPDWPSPTQLNTSRASLCAQPHGCSGQGEFRVHRR